MSWDERLAGRYLHLQKHSKQPEIPEEKHSRLVSRVLPFSFEFLRVGCQIMDLSPSRNTTKGFLVSSLPAPHHTLNILFGLETRFGRVAKMVRKRIFESMAKGEYNRAEQKF